MTKKITALKARHNLGQVLDEVFHRGDQYVIERDGKPMAAVVPLWFLEDWRKRKERVFGVIAKIHERTKDIAPETIERVVAEAVTVTRKKTSRRKA